MKTMPPEAQRALFDWYRMNARDLPWRRTRDPYRIMVAEIMLQQTQVDRVIPKYHAFLERFPTLEALADAPASEGDSGLGRAGLQPAGVESATGRSDGRRGVRGRDAAGGRRSTRRCRESGRTRPVPSPVSPSSRTLDSSIRTSVACFIVYCLAPGGPQLAVTPREIEQLAASNVPSSEGYSWKTRR